MKIDEYRNKRETEGKKKWKKAKPGVKEMKEKKRKIR